MRTLQMLLLATATMLASPSMAAEALKFGKAPEWVIPQAIPNASPGTQDRPVAILLHDQQTELRPGTITTYSEIAFRIQKPEGLSAGNLSIQWDPATDTATVNKLEIHRGDQIIDVLKSGQTFTTIRREANLDLAMLDGVLTANIQPEGLQEGDVVVLATTSEHADPVLKGHVEAIFAPWGAAQIGLAHARLRWPSTVPLKVQATSTLAAPRQGAVGGSKTYELTMTGVEPVISPKNAPVRYGIGRMGEATDFRSWSEAAKLMMPLYTTAAVIPTAGPLREELEKIRKASSDPRVRAELALRLVQDRVRYVALLMGQGGLVPATAQATWERRFGDCKAKTALLLALLHELGIQAEPVLANVAIGDAIAERVPMIGLFNHVLVRAHVAGSDYWLDGTRTGDKDLDAIETPDFGWVLPVTENAQLVHLMPASLTKPNLERNVSVDASEGLFAPAAITISEVYRNDSAVDYQNGYAQLSAEQRDEYFRGAARGYFDGFEVSSSTAKFDEATRTMSVQIKGTAKLNWHNGWFYVPTSSIAFDPDFERTALLFRDAPVKINHPRFVHDVATIKFPVGPAPIQKLKAPVKETLAGVEYARTETLAGDTITVESSERSTAPEVPYKDALAAAPRLRALDKEDVYLRMADNYRPSEKDWPAVGQLELTTADQFVDRGMLYADSGKFAEAVADYDKAMKLEPKHKWALADRAIAQVWLKHFDEAEKDLATLKSNDPDNPVGLRARALLAESKEDCATAVDFYTQSLAKDPNNNFAVGHRAMCEASLTKTDEALADSAAALRKDPTWLDLRVLRANLFVRRGLNDQVAKEAELMTSENPRAVFAYVAAGVIYARLARTADAMKAFDAALAIKPEAYVYLNRAQMRPRTDHARRIEDFDAAIRVEPTNTEALAQKAEELVSMGELKGALALYDEAMKIDPASVDLASNRAIAIYKMGRTSEAEALFKTIRSNAKTASELNAVCWNEAIAGVMLESALQACLDALKLHSHEGPLLDSLGMVLLKLGKLDDALDAYNKAVAKDTGADSLMGRAFVYLAKGDRPHAEADALVARKLYPNIDSDFASYGLRFDEGPPTAKTH